MLTDVRILRKDSTPAININVQHEAEKIKILYVCMNISFSFFLHNIS